MNEKIYNIKKQMTKIIILTRFSYSEKLSDKPRIENPL